MEHKNDIEKEAEKLYPVKSADYGAGVFDENEDKRNAYKQGRIDEKAVLPDLSGDWLNAKRERAKCLSGGFTGSVMLQDERIKMLEDLESRGIISLNNIKE